jgi:hypothetical protein
MRGKLRPDWGPGQVPPSVILSAAKDLRCVAKGPAGERRRPRWHAPRAAPWILRRLRRLRMTSATAPVHDDVSDRAGSIRATRRAGT